MGKIGFNHVTYMHRCWLNITPHGIVNCLESIITCNPVLKVVCTTRYLQCSTTCACRKITAKLNNYMVPCTYGDPVVYSRTSDNGPSEKRTLSVLRIGITILVILKQPPRSGRFSIPDSGQNPRSQTALYNAELPLNSGHQETTPLKLYIHTARPPSCVRVRVRAHSITTRTRA